MRSLKDTREGCKRRKWGISCEIGRSCAFVLHFSSFFVFRGSYSFFFRVTRRMKASNLKKSGAGNVRESLLLNHLVRGVFTASPFLASFYPQAPLLTRATPFFFGRSTLCVIFLILGVPSLRNAPGSRRTRVGYQRRLSEMG